MSNLPDWKIACLLQLPAKFFDSGEIQILKIETYDWVEDDSRKTANIIDPLFTCQKGRDVLLVRMPSGLINDSGGHPLPRFYIASFAQSGKSGADGQGADLELSADMADGRKGAALFITAKLNL